MLLTQLGRFLTLVRTVDWKSVREVFSAEGGLVLLRLIAIAMCTQPLFLLGRLSGIGLVVAAQVVSALIEIHRTEILTELRRADATGRGERRPKR